MSIRTSIVVWMLFLSLFLPLAMCSDIVYSPEPTASMANFQVYERVPWGENTSVMLPPYGFTVEFDVYVSLPTSFTGYYDGEVYVTGTLHPPDPEYPGRFYINNFSTEKSIIIVDSTDKNPIVLMASPGYGYDVGSGLWHIIGEDYGTDIGGGYWCRITAVREGNNIRFHVIQNWSVYLIFPGETLGTCFVDEFNNGHTYLDYKEWIWEEEEYYGLENGSLVEYMNDICSRLEPFSINFHLDVSLYMAYDAVDKDGDEYITGIDIDNVVLDFTQQIALTPHPMGGGAPSGKINAKVTIHQTFTDDDFFIVGKPLWVHIDMGETHTVTLSGYDRRLDGMSSQYRQRGSSLDFYVIFDTPGNRKLYFAFEDGSVHIEEIAIQPAGHLSLEFIPLAVGDWEKYYNYNGTDSKDRDTYEELFKAATYAKDFLEAIYPVKKVDITYYPWFHDVSFLWYSPFSTVNINALYKSDPEKAIKKTLWYFHSRYPTSADRIVLLVPKGWLSPIGAVGTTLTNRPYIWFGWSLGMAPYRVAIVEVSLPVDSVIGQVIAHEITHTFRFDDLPDNVQNGPPDINDGFWAKRGREMSGCYDIMADTWTLTLGKIWIYKDTYSYLYNKFFSSGDPIYLAGVFSNGTVDVTTMRGDYGSAPEGGNATIRLLMNGRVVAERSFDPVDLGDGEYGFMLDFSPLPKFDEVHVDYAGENYVVESGVTLVSDLHYEDGVLSWSGTGTHYEVICNNGHKEFLLGVTEEQEMHVRSPGGDCTFTVTAINGTNRASSSINAHMEDLPPLCALITDFGVAYAIAYDPEGSEVNVTLEHNGEVFGDWGQVTGGIVVAHARDAAGHETVVEATVPGTPRSSQSGILWLIGILMIVAVLAAALILWQKRRKNATVFQPPVQYTPPAQSTETPNIPPANSGQEWEYMQQNRP